MARREGLHLVQCIDELEVERLLRPERAVVVEDGYPLSRRNEGRSAFMGDRFDEAEERLLRFTVVPRRKRVGRAARGRSERDGDRRKQDERPQRRGLHRPHPLDDDAPREVELAVLSVQGRKERVVAAGASLGQKAYAVREVT